MRSYPKIYALGHAYLTDLLLDEVVVEEKVDGSQFSFGILGGVLRARSKSKELVIDHPEALFGKAVEVIKTLPLREGYVYRAEYLQKPKHNALSYNRAPTNHLALFDIHVGDEIYLSPKEKAEEAARIGIDCVPVFYRGKIENADCIREFLEHVSFLGGPKIEGVVIKNYHRFGIDGKAVMGKYVSEAFKEVHRTEWKVANPKSGDVIQNLKETLKTEARWRKAIQHLAENGTLQNAPQDIGPLIKEIVADTKEECTELIKQKLFEWAWPQIARAITSGFPEWYKNGVLLEKQFDPTQEELRQFDDNEAKVE